MLDYLKLTISKWPEIYTMAEVHLEEDELCYCIQHVTPEKETVSTEEQIYTGDVDEWLDDFDALNIREWFLQYDRVEPSDAPTSWDLEYSLVDENYEVKQGIDDYPDEWDDFMELLERLEDQQ